MTVLKQILERRVTRMIWNILEVPVKEGLSPRGSQSSEEDMEMGTRPVTPAHPLDSTWPATLRSLSGQYLAHHCTITLFLVPFSFLSSTLTKACVSALVERWCIRQVLLLPSWSSEPGVEESCKHELHTHYCLFIILRRALTVKVQTAMES